MAFLSKISVSRFLVPTQSRCFAASASVDVRQQFPRFETLGEVMTYADSHLHQMDHQTLHSFVHTVESHIRKAKDNEEVRNFKRATMFRDMLRLASRSVSQEDVRLAATQIQAMASLSKTGKEGPVAVEVKSAAVSLRDAVLSKRLPLDAKAMPAFLRAMVTCQAVNIPLYDMIKKTLPSMVSQMDPSQCRSLLFSMCQMNLRDADVRTPILNRMESGIDQFNNTDVVASLTVFSQTNFVSHPIVQRCVELLSQHAALFECDELLRAAKAAILLNRFYQISQSVLAELQKKSRILKAVEAVEVLRLLVFSGSKRNVEFAEELITLVANSKFPRTVGQNLALAHAICFFEILDRKDLLMTLAQDFIALESFNSYTAPGLIEILQSCKTEFNINIKIPQLLEEEYRNSRPFNLNAIKDIQSVMTSLPRSHQFQFETGISVGPFRPSLVDTKNRVVLEVEDSPSPYSNSLRFRLYKNLGFTATSVLSRLLYPTKDEARRIDYLIKRLDGAAVALKRITEEEVQSRRQSSRSV